MGLSKSGNIAVYRKAEIKHGRVCMLATLGIIVSERFHPFFDNWGDAPFVSAIQSHFSATAAENFWPAFWVLAAAHEFAPEFRGRGAGGLWLRPIEVEAREARRVQRTAEQGTQ